MKVTLTDEMKVKIQDSLMRFWGLEMLIFTEDEVRLIFSNGRHAVFRKDET